MMPTIRIEDDVFQGLKSLAEPFTDTPNTVIRRLLADRGVLTKKQVEVSAQQTANARVKAQSIRPDGVRANTLTPQTEYEQFLLHVLATDFNGRAAKNAITKAVIGIMETRGLIGSADMERVSTGETKAENTIAWGRNALKERGLISRHSPRGTWELTPKGLEQGKKTMLPNAKE